MPSNATRDTIARQWEVLKLLPSSHPGITAAQLQGALAKAGHAASKRTVERDLNELAKVFPLRCNDRNMPYGWHLQPARTLAVPGMNLGAGLTLHWARADGDISPAGVRPQQISLHAWVDDALAHRLAETPLSHDMQLTGEASGGATLAATVSDSLELMWWLLSNAGSLRIQAPEALRKAMLERLLQSLALHQG
ncbi:MAG TPA: WYL domain-containing protein [Pseudomonas sp.]|uniref:WYL domain-containing protein n=1 Tax=Pseudomonas sp. TaxID=306 RepID=UPI002B4A9B5B|nr:WYL domain-containing protein [Pseudomonas sp.]HKS14124.1 WYL domain-containing protein [Pseudomonas sp.]